MKQDSNQTDGSGVSESIGRRSVLTAIAAAPVVGLAGRAASEEMTTTAEETGSPPVHAYGVEVDAPIYLDDYGTVQVWGEVVDDIWPAVNLKIDVGKIGSVQTTLSAEEIPALVEALEREKAIAESQHGEGGSQ